MIALPALQRLVSVSPRTVAAAKCELCGLVLEDRHRHVVELGAAPGDEAKLRDGAYGVLCACRACSILFSRSDSLARFRTVPDRVMADPRFTITQDRWAQLGIPVGLAFFVRSSVLGRIVARYPGPAGVTEADLEPDAWNEIAAATSLAAKLEADVEALLVHAERGEPGATCFLIPVSDAYELAGRLRRTWQGFSGGDQARGELASFFSELAQRGGQR
jgi:hypothetical protein